MTTAQTRARNKILRDYAKRFGEPYGIEPDATVIRLAEKSLTTGIDEPELVERKLKWLNQTVAYFNRSDRRRDALLAQPITAEREARFTGAIKKRKLNLRSAALFPWERYFEYRDQHVDEVASLSAADLAYCVGVRV